MTDAIEMRLGISHKHYMPGNQNQEKNLTKNFMYMNIMSSSKQESSSFGFWKPLTHVDCLPFFAALSLLFLCQKKKTVCD
jgi:hypothetical protein